MFILLALSLLVVGLAVPDAAAGDEGAIDFTGGEPHFDQIQRLFLGVLSQSSADQGSVDHPGVKRVANITVDLNQSFLIHIEGRTVWIDTMALSWLKTGQAVLTINKQHTVIPDPQGKPLRQLTRWVNDHDAQNGLTLAKTRNQRR